MPYDPRHDSTRCSSTQALTALVALSIAATVGLVVRLGLVFRPFDAAQPLAIVGGLAGAAAYYRRRGVTNFVATLDALAALVAFTTVYAVLMYAIASTGRPWFDARLAACDAALGFSAPEVVAWFKARPRLELALEIAYFSAIPQTALVIIALGLGGRREELSRFLLRFVASAMLTALVFYVAPARGTCAYYDFEVPDHYRRILIDLEAMRTGAQSVVTWRDAEGLITCPSFHATWGLLLAMALWNVRYVRWPALALNAVMLVSCVPVGMHYLADVLAGGAVVAAVMAAESLVIGRVVWRWPATGVARSAPAPTES